MLKESSIGSAYLAWKLVDLLGRPFNQWKAFKLGLIDEKGNIIRQPKNAKEDNVFGIYEKMIRKLKFTMNKVIGNSKTASMLSTMMLMKENNIDILLDEFTQYIEGGQSMSTPTIESFASKTGKSIDEVDQLWNNAKLLAEKEGYEDDYAYITGILKRMLNTEMVSGDIATMPMAMGCDMNLKEPDCNGLYVRQPDCKGLYGYDAFTIKDDTTINNILNGRAKGQHWRKFINDEGILNWIKQNRLKSFYLKMGGCGIYIKGN